MASPNKPSWTKSKATDTDDATVDPRFGIHQSRGPWEEIHCGRRGLGSHADGRRRGAQPELLKIVAATLTGMTTEQFQADVKNWLATAKDHRWKRPYTELTYQPMQKVLKYLRANLRRGEEGWLVGHQHEERLEAYFCFRELTRIMCTRESKILLGRAAGL
jgi:hypothetical protein